MDTEQHELMGLTTSNPDFSETHPSVPELRFQAVDKNGKPISKIVPKFGSAKGMIVMHDDFEELLEDFKDYM